MSSPINEVIRAQNRDYRSPDWASSSPSGVGDLQETEAATERALSQALRYRGLSGQQSNQLQGAAARDAATVSRDAARDRTALDADREFNNSVRNFWQQREMAREQRGGDEVERSRERSNQAYLQEQSVAGQKDLARLQADSARELESLRGGTQREVAALDLAGRLGAARLGAQGQMFSSLFSSIGTGSPNARFWG